MKKGLLLSFTLLFVLIIFATGFTADKAGRESAQTYVHVEKGMKHNLVVMNDAATGKKAVVDTIEHFFYGDPAAEWVPGITALALVGDTLVNWFSFAADSATILGIQASFSEGGTGSWNVWPVVEGNSYFPDTRLGQLFFDVPWTVTADTAANGDPNGNMQLLDLEAQQLDVTVTPPLNDQGIPGVYVGYYYDANIQPKIWMDGGGHGRSGDFYEPGGWEFAKHWLSGQATPNWFFWASATQWVEFTMRLIVRYEQVAPFISNINDLPDYFSGNDVLDKTITADILDLDGTIQTAELKYQIRGTAIITTETMTLVSGDTYSADFSLAFATGDTVDYWVEATDNDANFKSTDGGSFAVIAPPAAGTDVLLIVDAGDGGEAVIEQSLINLTKDYYVWNADDHGGITSYEYSYGFNNIIWYGFGNGSMPSPFETASNGVSTYLDNGGNLMVVDKDYLFANGYTNETLVAGEFGYDYLGMEDGFSDPAVGDTIYYGMQDDPISGSYLFGVDSLVSMPVTFGTWSAASATDWSDYVNANSSADVVFYTPQSVGFGYNSAIRYVGTGFATAFLPIGLEAASQTQVDVVVGNTLDWFAVATGIGSNPGVATSYHLAQNYPNPFNPTTQISFSLKIAGNTELTVYNALGQKVVTLINNEMTSGTHNVQWNGLDANGKSVATGVYIYKLKSGDFNDTRKMLLIK